ncbi:MAG: HIG1 domain-containing protein [Novosphingobium sp.]|nr:HIG1 domain-containing protein [Novosphingobium sp.]
MNTVLVVVLIVFVVMAVVSLVRGIIAFLQSSKSDLETPGTGATPMQLKQNKMMFNRIMFQGLAIVVVALLLLFNR